MLWRRPRQRTTHRRVAKMLRGTRLAAVAGGGAAACSALALSQRDDHAQARLASTERLLHQPPRKRIAIYGGSFNPITNAHLNVAAEIMHSKLADEVWITPCGVRPDKPSLKTSMIHRLVMCHLAVDTTFGSRFGVKVCDCEADKPRAMPSVVLMRQLAEKYPEADFVFACGSDQISEAPPPRRHRTASPPPHRRGRHAPRATGHS